MRLHPGRIPSNPMIRKYHGLARQLFPQGILQVGTILIMLVGQHVKVPYLRMQYVLERERHLVEGLTPIREDATDITPAVAEGIFAGRSTASLRITNGAHASTSVDGGLPGQVLE